MTGRLRPGVVLGTNLAVATAAAGWLLVRYGRPALALLARDVAWATLAASAGCIALAFAGFAWRWQLLLATLGVRRAVTALVPLRMAAQTVSMLLPSARLGGEPVRAFLAARDGVRAPAAIASVAVDRVLEIGAGMPFALAYAGLLVQWGVPGLEGALVSVVVGTVALAAGIAMTIRRLRQGPGAVSAVVRATGLDRLRVVGIRLGVADEAERDGARLLAAPGRLVGAFLTGVAVNVLVMVEYHLLLSAFGLPAGGIAVVAAVFGTGAAHALPVPAAVGVLEGGQMWLFGMLGHPPEVGLAVGLAVRLRELAWVVPGLGVLAGRGVIGPLRRMAAAGGQPPSSPRSASLGSAGAASSSRSSR